MSDIGQSISNAKELSGDRSKGLGFGTCWDQLTHVVLPWLSRLHGAGLDHHREDDLPAVRAGIVEHRDTSWSLNRQPTAFFFQFIEKNTTGPGRVLLDELKEESGWLPIETPRSIAVLYDPSAYSWEIVFTMMVEPGAMKPTQPWEYDMCELVPAGSEPEPLAPVARQLLRIRDGLTDVRQR